jgi:transcription antitermination protein NusB
MPAMELAQLGWIDKDKLDGIDEETKVFARLLIMGAIENLSELDAAISVQLKNWDISRLSRVDLAILRLGAYALLHQRDIPATVTIDESVEIAKEYGANDSFKFVNGLLDAVLKARGD